MNYKKIYENIIEKARDRGLDKSKVQSYHEIHHIIPLSMGGSNDRSNLVLLTGREHFVCHYLLTKITPSRKTYYAFLCMKHTGNKSRYFNSRIYNQAKINSIRYGVTNPMYGKKHSEETREKLSKARRDRVTLDETREKVRSSMLGENNHMYGKRGDKSPIFGKSQSQEHRDKIGASCTGEKHYNYGKKLTLEHRRKISEGLRRSKSGNTDS
jgi:hypothetical protein